MYTIGPITEVNIVLFQRNKRFNVKLFCLITNLGCWDYQLRSAHAAKYVWVAVITHWGYSALPPPQWCYCFDLISNLFCFDFNMFLGRKFAKMRLLSPQVYQMNRACDPLPPPGSAHTARLKRPGSWPWPDVALFSETSGSQLSLQEKKKICKRGLEMIREKNQFVLITIICVPHLLMGVEPCHLPLTVPSSPQQWWWYAPSIPSLSPCTGAGLNRWERPRVGSWTVHTAVSINSNSQSSVRSEPRLVKDRAHLDIKILTLFKDSFNILKLLIICHLSSNR